MRNTIVETFTNSFLSNLRINSLSVSIFACQLRKTRDLVKPCLRISCSMFEPAGRVCPYFLIASRTAALISLAGTVTDWRFASFLMI